MSKTRTLYRAFIVALALASGTITCTPPSAVTLEMAQTIANTQQDLDILLFAPDYAKTYKQILLWLMERTDGKIQAALYRLTDKDIMNGLANAYARGVKVEVVFDPGAATSGNYSLGLTLCKLGIPTYVYRPQGIAVAKAYPSIMHHKTFIFTWLNGQSFVAYGSLNPTNAGFNGNQEAMQIRSKGFIVDGFKQQFQKLLERSRFMDENQAKQLIANPNSPSFLENLLRKAPILRSLLRRNS